MSNENSDILDNELFMSKLQSSSLDDLKSESYVDRLFCACNIKVRDYMKYVKYVQSYVAENSVKIDNVVDTSNMHISAKSNIVQDIPKAIYDDNDFDFEIKTANEVSSWSKDDGVYRSPSTVGMSTAELIRSEANKYPTMTDHRRHFAEYRKYLENGDIEKAKDKENEIFLSNQKLIMMVINKKLKYLMSDVPFEDLFGYGTFALLRAIQEYNPDKKEFSTFASQCILNEIKKMVAKDLYTVKYSGGVIAKYRKIKVIESMLINEHGDSHKPTYEEIAVKYYEVMNSFITSENVREVLESVHQSSSVDVQVGEDEDTRMVDLIADKNSPDPSESYENNELREILLRATDTLSHREADILLNRFALNPECRKYSHQELAIKHNLSKERIRQIEEDSLQRLSHYGRAKEFINYMYEDFDY